MVAELPRLVRQVVRIDADAVTADEPGRNFRKFHFVPAACEHVRRIDAHAVEDDRELVHQRDVEVALRVLDDLRGLGDLDRRRAVDARRDDAAVERGDALERLGVSPETTFMILVSVCSLSPGLMRSGE